MSISDATDFSKKIGTAACEVRGDWQGLWVPHPDETVDLGALMLAPVLHKMVEIGYPAFGIAFHEREIIDTATLSSLTPIEDILMIGYPIGMHDEHHNLPVVRRGITATDVRLPFNGQQEFLIDCACWPGSSGSPIWLKEREIYMRPDGTTVLGRRPGRLIGVLYAGPVHISPGRIEYQEIPTAQVSAVATPQMIHIGRVINTNRVRELCELAKHHNGEIRCQLIVTPNLYVQRP